MIGIFRDLGFPVNDGFSYSTVGLISFAYIVVFEAIFASIVTVFAQKLSAKAVQKGIKLSW